jgi:hypothetical protein
LRLADTDGSIFAFPSETKFKTFCRDGKRRLANAAESYYRRCRHLGLDHERFDAVAYADRAERIRNSTGDLATVICRDAVALVDSIRDRQEAPSIFVMKEVGGGNPVRVVGLFRSTFPEGRLILIARNPKYTARAVYRSRRREGAKLGLIDLLNEAVDPIRVGRAQMRFFAEQVIPTLMVRYEDIVGGKIEETMRRIATFLDVPFTNELERPTLFGAPVVVKTSSRQTTDVFRDTSDWPDGLEPREKAAIRLANWFYSVDT